MLGRRHILKQSRHLEGADQSTPDAADGIDPGDGFTAEANIAGIRPQIAGDEIDEGGLAGAVRADQRHAVARLPSTGVTSLVTVKSAEGFLQIE